MTDAKADMRPFWDTVGRAIYEQDFYVSELGKGSVSNLIVGGYLKIVAHGVEYRSVAVEDRVAWVTWEAYEIVGHFSKLTDPNATIEWVPHRSNEPGKVYAVLENTPEEYESL